MGHSAVPVGDATHWTNPNLKKITGSLPRRRGWPEVCTRVGKPPREARGSNRGFVNGYIRHSKITSRPEAPQPGPGNAGTQSATDRERDASRPNMTGRVRTRRGFPIDCAPSAALTRLMAFARWVVNARRKRCAVLSELLKWKSAVQGSNARRYGTVIQVLNRYVPCARLPPPQSPCTLMVDGR
jgi:hypothetical protein